MLILKYRILNLNSKYTQNIVYSNKHNSGIPLPPQKNPCRYIQTINSGGTMELHPLLSRLEKTDLEQYMDACKADVMNFLEELGLSDTLALQVLEDVRASIS
jgi:hypothetical protein